MSGPASNEQQIPDGIYRASLESAAPVATPSGQSLECVFRIIAGQCQGGHLTRRIPVDLSQGTDDARFLGDVLGKELTPGTSIDLQACANKEYFLRLDGATGELRIVPESAPSPDPRNDSGAPGLPTVDPAVISSLSASVKEQLQRGERRDAVECTWNALIDSGSPARFQNVLTSLHAEAATELQSHVQSILSRSTLKSSERAALEAFAANGSLPLPWKAAWLTADLSGAVKQNSTVQGFATGEPRRAQQLETPLCAQFLLLEDENAARLLIMAADIFGFGDDVVAAIREIARPWGIPPEAIILNASHTHFAPGTISNLAECLGTQQLEFVQTICRTTTQVLPVLFDRLESCLLFSGTTRARIGVNRRLPTEHDVQMGPNPSGCYETATPVLHVCIPSRGERLVMASHGCHPTAGSAPVVTAEYPAFMRTEIQKRMPDTDGMFLQAAAGDIKQTSPDHPGQFATNTSEAAINGARLGDAVAETLSEPLQPVKGSIFAQRRRVTLPMHPAPGPTQLVDVFSGHSDRLIANWAGTMLVRPDLAQGGDLPLEVQTVCLGDQVGFITLPGEPVCELGRSLLDLLPESSTRFMLGYTNGLKAYLPCDRMLPEGGYEADRSKVVYNLPGPFLPGIDERLGSAVRSSLSDARKGDDASAYGRHHLMTPDRPAFFCMSSGRCGTMTLAHVLETADNAQVYHHPYPYLVAETGRAWHNAIDCRDTFWRFRGGVIRQAWAQGQVFGELDVNMTPFAKTIAAEIPHAKFLVLVRHPAGFVRSGMRRNYYLGGNIWDNARLRPEPDHPDAERFESLNQFEKVCWLWNETYKRIREFVAQVGEDRCLTVRFEDVIKGPKAFEPLFEFLGLTGYDPETVRTVLAQKLNEQTAGDFPHPRDWPEELHACLWEQCGETASAFGYAPIKSQAGTDSQPVGTAVGG